MSCYVLLVVGVSEQLVKRFNQKPSWNPVKDVVSFVVDGNVGKR